MDEGDSKKEKNGITVGCGRVGIAGIVVILCLFTACKPPGHWNGRHGRGHGDGNDDHEEEVKNQAPEITSQPPGGPTYDNAYLYQARATDPDGDLLAWSLMTAPEGMHIDGRAGLVYGSDLSPGEHAVSILVEDGRGGTDMQDFTVTVSGAPVIDSIPPRYVFSGTPYLYGVEAADPNGLDLGYSLDAGPAGMSVDRDTGLVEWHTTLAGSYEVAVSAANTLGVAVTQAYNLVVLPENGLSIVSVPVEEAYVSQPYEYRLSTLFQTAPVTVYILNGGPPGMTIDTASGLISWKPGSAGIYPVAVTVMNSLGYTDDQNFEIVVRTPEEMDREFSGLVDGLFETVSAGDLDGVNRFLTGDAITRLVPVLRALQPYMAEIVSGIAPLTRLNLGNDTAEYITSRTLNGESRLFIVSFLQDDDGQWKIQGM